MALVKIVIICNGELFLIKDSKSLCKVNEEDSFLLVYIQGIKLSFPCLNFIVLLFTYLYYIGIQTFSCTDEFSS